MFSTFPDGWPGLGLLLLRAAAGGVLAVRCILYLGARHDFAIAVMAALFLTFVSAVFLLLGYRTRAAATVDRSRVSAAYFSGFPSIRRKGADFPQRSSALSQRR